MKTFFWKMYITILTCRSSRENLKNTQIFISTPLVGENLYNMCIYIFSKFLKRIRYTGINRSNIPLENTILYYDSDKIYTYIYKKKKTTVKDQKSKNDTSNIEKITFYSFALYDIVRNNSQYV